MLPQFKTLQSCLIPVKVNFQSYANNNIPPIESYIQPSQSDLNVLDEKLKL